MLANHWKPIGVLVAIVLAIVFVATNFQADCLGSTSISYFTLPANAEKLEQHTLRFSRSCTLSVKFEIIPESLDSFVSTTFVQRPLSSTNPPKLIGGIENLKWLAGWDVTSVTSYLAGEAGGIGETHLDEQVIFVDTSNSERFVVYLVTKRNWL